MTRLFARRAVPALAAAVVLLVLTAAAASAHAVLTSSDPPAGASVTTLPSTVALRFSDPIELDGASVMMRSAGSVTSLTNLRLDGPDAIVADVPDAGTVRGPVTYAWTVVAADGHESSGVVDVGVGMSATTIPDASTGVSASRADRVEQLFEVDRVIGYLAMATLVGGWVFLTTVWPAGAVVSRVRVVLWLAWSFGLIATVAGVQLQAATVAGGRLGSAFSRSSIADVLATDFGHAWIARLVLFALAVPVVRALRADATVPRSSWWIVSAATVGIGLLRTPGFVSHAGEGDLAVVGSIADLVHLVGIAVWLGGLMLLLTVVLPRRQPRELAQILPRFSKIAMGSVVAIVAGGAVMSWELVGGFDHLLSTHFGRVLFVKMIAFAGIVAVARASKRWVDDRLGVAVALRGHASIVRPFVYSVAAEALLAASVVAVASVLVSTSPGT